MEYSLNMNKRVISGKVAIWKIQVGVFDPAMLYSRELPAKFKRWKLFIVMN